MKFWKRVILCRIHKTVQKRAKSCFAIWRVLVIYGLNFWDTEGNEVAYTKFLRKGKYILASFYPKRKGKEPLFRTSYRAIFFLATNKFCFIYSTYDLSLSLSLSLSLVCVWIANLPPPSFSLTKMSKSWTWIYKYNKYPNKNIKIHTN